MAYEYIAKALDGIMSVTDARSLNLCDRIADKLTISSSSVASSANRAANLFFAGHHLRNSLSAHGPIIRMRRAALLLKDLFPDEARGVRLAATDEWNEIALGTYVNHFKTRPAPSGSGFYLRGSFWAYADDSDRDKARAAWGEMLEQLEAGLQAARSTSADATMLRRRWFGTNDRTLLISQFSKLKTALATHRVGIGYQGDRTNTITGPITERGQNADGNPGPVRHNTVIGNASRTLDSLCLGSGFFNLGPARIRRTRRHDITAYETDITRGGTILHELTHRFLSTVDVTMSFAVETEVRQQMGLAPPAPRGIGHVAQASYGPLVCSTLARHVPAHHDILALPRTDGAWNETALNNADNYRLFCEDALL